MLCRDSRQQDAVCGLPLQHCNASLGPHTHTFTPNFNYKTWLWLPTDHAHLSAADDVYLRAMTTANDQGEARWLNASTSHVFIWHLKAGIQASTAERRTRDVTVVIQPPAKISRNRRCPGKRLASSYGCDMHDVLSDDREPTQVAERMQCSEVCPFKCGNPCPESETDLGFTVDGNAWPLARHPGAFYLRLYTSVLYIAFTWATNQRTYRAFENIRVKQYLKRKYVRQAKSDL